MLYSIVLIQRRKIDQWEHLEIDTQIWGNLDFDRWYYKSVLVYYLANSVGQLSIWKEVKVILPLFHDTQVQIPRWPKDWNSKSNLRIKHGESLESRTKEGFIFK